MKKIFIILSLLVAGTAQAAKIGTAGCGLGNMLIGSDPGMIQIAVATVNATGAQTFGITSGTSNCVDSSRMAQIETYIDVNKVALANDVSRGQGESVSGLVSLLGCTNTAAAKDVLKTNFKSIFPSQNESAASITDNVLKTMKSNGSAAQCGHVG